jgi:hypothetical protein
LLIGLMCKNCIIWPKKSRKGKHEWNKTCIASSFHPRKLNILVKTRLNVFKLFFEFFILLNFCNVFFY